MDKEDDFGFSNTQIYDSIGKNAESFLTNPWTYIVGVYILLELFKC